MKQYIYPLLLGVLLLLGCKKDREAPLVLVGKYEASTSPVAATPIRLYTVNGIVDNQVIVDNFIKRQSWVQDYFFRNAVPAPNNASLVLAIRSNMRATLIDTHATSTDSVRAEVLSQNDQSFLLANVDSASVLLSSNSTSRCEQLGERIKNVYPGKRCRSLPPFTGYSSYCMIRPVRVITIKNGNLFIPQFTWLVKTGQPSQSICGLAYSKEWNTFNPAILNQLVAGDTIVVQEREIPLLKK